MVGTDLPRPAKRLHTQKQGKEGQGTVVSKIVTPEFLFFSEFIRRGVIDYAGKFLPPIFFCSLIMRGDSVSHYMDRPVFWGKNDFKNLMGINFPTGRFQNYPAKSFLNQLGNNLGYNGNLLGKIEKTYTRF